MVADASSKLHFAKLTDWQTCRATLSSYMGENERAMLIDFDATYIRTPGQARPTMSMRFRPMFAMPAGPSLSRPLKELSMLANGCEPCSRVQSHMRSMSVMLGPNGQRVETAGGRGSEGNVFK